MRPVRILLVGDSITAGYPTAHGFRYELAQRLADAWPADAPPLFVSSTSAGLDAHEGHGGWTSTMLADKAHEWIDASNPDVVVVIAGTNDTAADATIANVGHIAQLARSHGSAVVLATPPHAHPRNDDLRKLARALRGQVRFVDLANASIDLSDNVHPSERGYSTIAGELVNAIPPRARRLQGFGALIMSVLLTWALGEFFREMSQ